MNIHEKLATIQTKFKAQKSRFNGFGKYNYRSAEDILEAIKPFLLELKCSVVVNEELIDQKEFNFPVLVSKATITDYESSGSSVDGFKKITATAIVAVDMEQKGMQMPQRFGAASSYGKKYALGNLLLIDDTQDADATNNHGKGELKPREIKKSKLEGDALEKAKDYLLKGGKLEDIQKKYEIPAKTLTELKKIKQ